MLKLKCQCCGFEQEFACHEDAFEAGWDAPPYFTGYISCDLCPGVCLVMGVPHTKAHAYWDEHVRPADFNERCYTDDQFDNPRPLGDVVKDGEKIVSEFLGEIRKSAAERN